MLQNVRFRVTGKKSEVGIASKYDFISKSLYVAWKDSQSSPEKIVQVPIHKLNLVKCLTDDNAQIKLFDSIASRVQALRSRLCKEAATSICNAALFSGRFRAASFLVEWQNMAYETMISEVVLEMASDEASEDMEEAINEYKRRIERARLNAEAAEKRKEEERQRALLYKKKVQDFAAKNVNKLTKDTVPWLSTLMWYFNMFDMDGSGSLDALEVIAALRMLGISKKVQEQNTEIMEMFTRFRRHSGEISLASFMEDMPKVLYEAIRHHGDKSRRKAEMKRKLFFGGVPDDGLQGEEGGRERTASDEKRFRFDEGSIKKERKMRKRFVVKDRPLSDFEICQSVLSSLVQEVVLRGKQKRSMSSSFKCSAEIGFDSSIGSNKYNCEVHCIVGGSCVFSFLGEEVLPKPKPDMNDDRAMERFDAALAEYGVTFDEMLDEFGGFVDVDNAGSVAEACAVGIMERLNESAREKYLEIKKKLRKALLVPLEFERLLVSWRGGHIERMIFYKTNMEEGTGGKVERVFLDNFKARALRAGFSFTDRNSYITGTRAPGERRGITASMLGENWHHDDGSELSDVKLVCKRAGLGHGTMDILSSMCDIGFALERIWELTGGFKHDGVNTLKKARSRFIHDGSTMRFVVTKEESGCVTEGSLSSEGVIECIVTMKNIESLIEDKDFEIFKEVKRLSEVGARGDDAIKQDQEQEREDERGKNDDSDDSDYELSSDDDDEEEQADDNKEEEQADDNKEEEQAHVKEEEQAQNEVIIT